MSPVRLAAAFAARGLRLVGLSSSPQRASAICDGMRSVPVTSGSVLDAVLSLVGEQQAALA